MFVHVVSIIVQQSQRVDDQPEPGRALYPNERHSQLLGGSGVYSQDMFRYLALEFANPGQLLRVGDSPFGIIRAIDHHLFSFY